MEGVDDKAGIPRGVPATYVSDELLNKHGFNQREDEYTCMLRAISMAASEQLA